MQTCVCTGMPVLTAAGSAGSVAVGERKIRGKHRLGDREWSFLHHCITKIDQFGINRSNSTLSFQVKVRLLLK